MRKFNQDEYNVLCRKLLSVETGDDFHDNWEKIISVQEAITRSGYFWHIGGSNAQFKFGVYPNTDASVDLMFRQESFVHSIHKDYKEAMVQGIWKFLQYHFFIFKDFRKILKEGDKVHTAQFGNGVVKILCSDTKFPIEVVFDSLKGLGYCFSYNGKLSEKDTYPLLKEGLLELPYETTDKQGNPLPLKNLKSVLSIGDSVWSSRHGKGYVISLSKLFGTKKPIDVQFIKQKVSYLADGRDDEWDVLPEISDVEFDPTHDAFPNPFE